MSDDEVIKFEITDYDINNEFNTKRNRRGTKEQQIYGVWAQDSDVEDEVEERKRGRDKKPKDYAAPIGFIAGGVQQAGKKKQEKDSTVKDETTFKPETDSSEEEVVQTPGENETAGLRRRGFGLASKGPKLGGKVGNWERHTKGIGAKLLLQMGYEPGKGLGKALQGISAPVEASVRKGRGAIGAYGPEKATMKIKKDEASIKALKDKEEAPKKTGNWKKTHKGRYFYRDAWDVIQEGKPTSTHTESSAALARVPVIDMTGKGKVVLSGYHALRSARGTGDSTEDGAPTTRYEDLPRKDCRNFSVPELMHNLDLLVDCCEQDIIQNARAGHTADDEVVIIQKELQDLEFNLKSQDSNVDTLESLLTKLENLNRPDLSFEDVYIGFTDLKINHPAEYEAFALSSVFEGVVGPIITPIMAAWKPLENPSEPIPMFLQCQELMNTDTYHSLLWQQFVTTVRRAAQEWNPRKPQSLLDVCSVWSEVAPTWLVTHAVAASAGPRLAEAAREWDPTIDPQPLHEWVLPWHSIAEEELSASVYPVLRDKLSAALDGWHPADGSARPLLEPWKQAWGANLTTLFNHHILPKLDACLLAEPIDLTGAKSAAWGWCVEWSSVGGWQVLAAVAARSFLPRWLASLASWLNTSPPHANVLASYTAWKALFPEEVLREASVREIFRKALDMMNRSADMDVEIPPPPSLQMQPIEPKTIAEILGSSNQQKTFMELLESKCSQNGINFIPMAGKVREGRPLFRIGTMLQCYVIRNVVMYSNDLGRSYQPISLDSLLHMAATQ